MAEQESLRPVDVVVALRLLLTREEGYEALAQVLGIGVGSAHRSVQRLQAARLVHPHRRATNAPALLEFLLHGVRYAFYPLSGPEAPGVPTAHAGPPLAGEVVSDRAIVWPTASGSIRGESLTPLYAGAVDLPGRDPELYEILTLVDAIRVGRARERALATDLLRERLLASRTS